MDRLSKYLSIFWAVIFALSILITIIPTEAQTIPKPSAPEITVRFVDNSYYVQPDYSYNTYTGKNEIVKDGYYAQNKNIEVRVKNQPFTSYTNSNGNLMLLWYIVQTRGHFGGTWWSINDGFYGDNAVTGGKQVDGYTVITYGLIGNNDSLGHHNLDIADGGKADFRVRAFIGYYTDTVTMTMLGESHHYDFVGEYSDWSNTQTITIGESSSTNTPTPTVPEFPITATSIAVLVAVSLLLVAGKRKQSYNH